MTTDAKRTDGLLADASYLESVGFADPVVGQRIQQIIHNIRKYCAFVVERDAGPNREATAEILRLSIELEAANRVAKEIDVDFLSYRERTKPMRAENQNLKNQLQGLRVQAQPAPAAIPDPSAVVLDTNTVA